MTFSHGSLDHGRMSCWSNIDRSRMITNIIGGKGNKDRQVMLAENLIPLLENYYRQYKTLKLN